MLDIRQIPVLNDNYIYLVHEPESGCVAIVDPAVSDPVLAEAARLGWKITHIFNTHHHGDHTGGNLAIQRATGCAIVGARADAARIPGIGTQLSDGDSYEFGAERAKVFDVPGHTSGHIAFWFEASNALFCGDTLFALGCGRVFEGTPAEMWNSLKKLRALPDETRVYCAHEYTQANAAFALTVETDNADLKRRAAAIAAARADNRPTVPSLLKEEKRTNPFLRADDPGLAANLGLANASAEEVFAEVRHRKDVF